MLQLITETKELKQHFMEFNFHVKMDTIDMSDYFPLTSDSDIQNFMRHDDEWNQRKKGSV